MWRPLKLCGLCDEPVATVHKECAKTIRFALQEWRAQQDSIEKIIEDLEEQLKVAEGR